MDQPTVSIPGGRPGPDNDPQEWGPFVLLGKLGGGAFGEVYRAWDATLERHVALKLLRSQGDDEGIYEAAVREARLIAKVRHPNIVPVHGVSRHEGRVGFWSDLVQGRTLSDLLVVQGPMSPAEAAGIGIEICRALGAVHAAGLLHRDIKASNVMREEGGRILLMDFGLSHPTNQKSLPAGTRGYMAPEILVGDSASVASDVYALGALLFHLVTAKYPDDGTPHLMDLRPDLPSGFVQVVETAISREAGQRYPSAGRLSGALSRFAGTGEPAPEELTETAVIRPNRRRRYWLVMGLAVVIALAAAYYVAYVARPTLSHRPAAAYQPYVEAQQLLLRYDQPGNTAKAVQKLEKAVAESPKSALVHAGLARAYWRSYLDKPSPEWIAKALAQCQLALEMDPQLATAQVTLGMIHAGTGRLDLAAAELQAAERLDKQSPDLYAGLADLYQKQGRSGDAVEAFQKAIDLAPDDWRWPYLLSSQYLYMGKFAPAEEQVRRALRLSPDNSRAFYNLGTVYFRQAKYTEAQDAFEKSIERAPTYNALSSLGATYVLKGEHAKAVEALSRAAQLNPDNFATWANLASAYDRLPGGEGKAREARLKAIPLGLKFLKDNPKDPNAAVRLGSSYASLLRPDEAVPLLRKAVALLPGDPDILFRAGEAYEIMGRREAALNWIEKALELGYNPEFVKRSPHLEQLRKDRQAPVSIR